MSANGTRGHRETFSGTALTRRQLLRFSVRPTITFPSSSAPRRRRCRCRPGRRRSCGRRCRRCRSRRRCTRCQRRRRARDAWSGRPGAELPRHLPPLPAGLEPPDHALELLPQLLGVRAVPACRQVRIDELPILIRQLRLRHARRSTGGTRQPHHRVVADHAFMPVRETLARVDADLAGGRVRLARQRLRLRGLISSFPHDLTLRRRPAEVYRLYGDAAELDAGCTSKRTATPMRPLSSRRGMSVPGGG